MFNLWEFFGHFEFIGRLVNLSVRGVSVYYLYSVVLFAGFWAYLAYALAKKRGELLSKIFLWPGLYLALLIAACFFLFRENNLYSAYTYEVRNLADAAAAVGAKDGSLLLRQTRVVPLIFGAVLFLSGLQALTMLLCVFLGVFYAIWERILEEVFGFKTLTAFPVMLFAAFLHEKMYYFFSAYSILALCFSALFLYSLLTLQRAPEKKFSFFRLAQPVYIILLAALFRQESVVLFPVYLGGAAFLGKPMFKKAVLCLFAGAVLYLPFLYSDWTREENQVFSGDWDQRLVEAIYDRPLHAAAHSGAGVKSSMLANVASNIKEGGRFSRLSRQEFIDAVRTSYFTPHPALADIWGNLKYRSALFLRLSALWFAFFVLGLLNLRHLRQELGYLAVLSLYIWSVFFIYHLASLAIRIGLAYNYLLPAYLAFCLLVTRGLYHRRTGAG